MTPTQQEALEAALAALESERIMAADSEGNYTIEVTPKRVTAAIEKIKAVLAAPKHEQEPVGADPHHLSRILHEMAGSVSGCWEHVDKAGVFQTAQATEFVAKAIAEIRQRMKEAAPRPREWKELSERELINCLLAANISEFVRMTREVGPYSLTEPTAPAAWLYKNISAALREKNGDAT